MNYFKFLIGIFLVFSFNACEKKSTTDVAKVHWDRDMCARCVMVVSDRHNTTQARDPKTGKQYMFDDIGCMALWFNEEKISWSKEAIIWITDVKTAKWIDAKKAYYTTENVTPMAFGFSAYKSKDSIKDAKEIITYGEVINRVLNP